MQVSQRDECAKVRSALCVREFVCGCEVVCKQIYFCVKESEESHLDCKAAFAAADRLLVCLPLVRPTRLGHVDVFLPAETLP